jgi:hypothetical protein
MGRYVGELAKRHNVTANFASVYVGENSVTNLPTIILQYIAGGQYKTDRGVNLRSSLARRLELYSYSEVADDSKTAKTWISVKGYRTDLKTAVLGTLEHWVKSAKDSPYKVNYEARMNIGNHMYAVHPVGMTHNPKSIDVMIDWICRPIS